MTDSTLDTRCSAITIKGTNCTYRHKPNSSYCSKHIKMNYQHGVSKRYSGVSKVHSRPPPTINIVTGKFVVKPAVNRGVKLTDNSTVYCAIPVMPWIFKYTETPTLKRTEDSMEMSNTEIYEDIIDDSQVTFEKLIAESLIKTPIVFEKEFKSFEEYLIDAAI